MNRLEPNQLPPEMWYCALNFLNYTELNRSSLVNWTWNELCSEAARSQNKEKIIELFAYILRHPTFEKSPVFAKGLTDLQVTLWGEAKVPSFAATLSPFRGESNALIVEKIAEGFFDLCTKEDETAPGDALETCWEYLCQSEDPGVKMNSGTEFSAYHYSAEGIISPYAVGHYLKALRLIALDSEPNVMEKDWMRHQGDCMINLLTSNSL